MHYVIHVIAKIYIYSRYNKLYFIRKFGGWIKRRIAQRKKEEKKKLLIVPSFYSAIIKITLFES